MSRSGPASAIVVCCALVVLGGVANAWAGESEERARQELERQLREMVPQVPPPRVVIEFEAIDEPNFKLEAADFMLDGRPLAAPGLDVLNKEGTHKVYAAELPEGRHELLTRVTYVDDSSVLVSSQAGFKWKVSAAARFELRKGLEVTIHALPERDASEPDPKKQLHLRHTQKVEMLAQVDTSLPPPAQKKGAAAAQQPSAVDAGTPAPPADTQAKAKVAQDDEKVVPVRGKKRGAKVKLAKATGKRAKTKTWAPKSLTATSEPETSDAEDAAGSKAAAVEPAGTVPAGFTVPPAPVAKPEPIAAATPDAGTPIAAAEPSAPESSGALGQYFLYGGGGIALLALIAVVLRRRGRVPTLKD